MRKHRILIATIVIVCCNYCHVTTGKSSPSSSARSRSRTSGKRSTSKRSSTKFQKPTSRTANVSTSQRRRPRGGTSSSNSRKSIPSASSTSSSKLSSSSSSSPSLSSSSLKQKQRLKNVGTPLSSASISSSSTSSRSRSAIEEEIFDFDLEDDGFDIDNLSSSLDNIIDYDSTVTGGAGGGSASGASDSTNSILGGGGGSGVDLSDSDFDFNSEFDMNDMNELSKPISKSYDIGMEEGDDEEYGQGTEKGALYDAYNLLHTLAQDFEKPFDAPAVVVVGHQSSGKSALIEALMGFQFNQVGGGTKTRRPIALRMQYNPQCTQPKCFLQDDDNVERPKTLSEIQKYVEMENKRLERDPVRCFDSREINIRMEYKYCPNMILIDTPGLIAAPKIPRGRMNSGAVSMQQRALLKSAREAERLVVQKMKVQDYIILCVEDTMDWKHGATREIVQKADPDLSRTIIVNTKLDTKIPQFGSPSDICDFLRASVIDSLSPHKMGGPFFTSVPSGRVGRPEDNDSIDDYLFEHDDEFVESCGDNEKNDRISITERLRKITLSEGKSKSAPKSALKSLLPRVGLSRLRGFLERKVDECYRRNVAKIVPMLQAEHDSCKRRLELCEKELDAISIDRLKQGADTFCDEFCAALRETIKGTTGPYLDTFGETLETEIAAAGSFHDVQGCPMSVSERAWARLVETEVGNEANKLYGGAQYHRTMREFNLASRCLRLPNISEDEIANAAGMGENHDGVNFLRAACVISLEKARMSFDPLLDALRIRMNHVMGKNCRISERILEQKKERAANSYGYGGTGLVGVPGSSERDQIADITQNPQFRQLVRTIFDKYVKKCSEATMARCYDDLYALTKFVTWDNERSSGALKRALPDQSEIVSIYNVAVKAAEGENTENMKQQMEEQERLHRTVSKRKSDEVERVPNKGQDERDYLNLVQLMNEAVLSRNPGRTNMVIGGLVQHIVAQWRETFTRSVTTKFNCYFLLPFVDDFHKYLRQELQKVYDGEGDTLSDVFDLIAARKALQQRRQDLIAECNANTQLQERFEMVSRMMREQQMLNNDDMISSSSRPKSKRRKR